MAVGYFLFSQVTTNFEKFGCVFLVLNFRRPHTAQVNQKWSKAVGHSKRDFKNTVLLLSKQNLIKLKIGPVQILQHPRRLRSRSSYLLTLVSNLHGDFKEKDIVVSIFHFVYSMIEKD